MEAAPAASFVVAQAEFLFQFLVIAFDDPAMFGQVHQFSQTDVRRQGGQPVLGGFRFPGWPFDQQPFFRMWLRAPIVAMRGAHPHGGKAGLQCLFHPLPPGHLFQASTGSDRASSFAETGWCFVSRWSSLRGRPVLPLRAGAGFGSSPGFQTVVVLWIPTT